MIEPPGGLKKTETNSHSGAEGAIEVLGGVFAIAAVSPAASVAGVILSTIAGAAALSFGVVKIITSHSPTSNEDKIKEAEQLFHPAKRIVDTVADTLGTSLPKEFRSDVEIAKEATELTLALFEGGSRARAERGKALIELRQAIIERQAGEEKIDKLNQNIEPEKIRREMVESPNETQNNNAPGNENAYGTRL